jgi:serine/threonine-protein kinase
MSPPADDARLLALFDEVVDLDATARAARLDALRAAEPALAGALEAMLAADAGADGVVDTGHRPAAAALAAAATLPVAGAPGRLLGPFVLERLLGQGGMGEVWLARRRDGDFAQSVALKLLRRGLRSDDLLRRFARERRILAALAHPGIARFIDGGVGEDGMPWYAMDYVDGVALTTFASERKLGVRDCVALVAEVADAVAYAQNHLVVHRDLKPSNILVDRDGRPWLLDFGIAKLLDDTADAEQTASGVHAFSPAYAAPEQVLGEPISAATDVYALGTVLFELLTGALPHDRADRPLAVIAAGIAGETAQRPGAWLRREAASQSGATTRTGGRRAREIDGEIDTIVQKCLRAEPARRYPSAAALSDDLRRWLDGRPVRAQPDTASYRLRKFVARHRLAVGSASAVVLALVAGFGTALWQAARAHEAAQRAEAQATLARKAQADAEAVNQFFGRMLIDARAMDQAAGVELTVRDWVLAALPRLDSALGDAPAARATLRRELGSALQQLGEGARAREVLETAVEENRAAYGDSAQLAATTSLLAVTRFALGEPAQAREAAEAAIAIADRVPQDDDVRNIRIQARTTLIRILSLAGDHAAALALSERNLAERGALLGADHPKLAVDYNNLAAVYSRLARLADAEAAQRRSLELLERDPARPVARIAFVRSQLCMLAVQRAGYADALAHCAQAGRDYTSALGADSIELAGLAVTEAHVRFAAGDADTARALLDAAEPRLEAAARAVDVRIARLLRLRLAVHDACWAALGDGATRLQAVLPPPTAGGGSEEHVLAAAFGHLARAMRSASESDRRAVQDAAEALLARDDVVPYYRATIALAAALAAESAGDVAAATTYRERGLAALSLNMPREAAEALWAHWRPRTR